MILEFTKVHIENFLSFDKADVELSNKGFVRVVGVNQNDSDNAVSNGSGKSAIWDAISWVLTGETIRGDNKHIENIYTEGGTLVDIIFYVDDVEYEIIRTKNHSKLGTDLKIYINGEDKSGKGIRDGERLLEEYLPEVSSLLLGSVVLLGQGLPQRFSNNTPSGRKEVLEKLCKSDFMISDLKKRISERKSELENDINNAKNHEISYQASIDANKCFVYKFTKELDSLSPVSDAEISLKSDEKSALETKKFNLSSIVDKLEHFILTAKDKIHQNELKTVTISQEISNKYAQQFIDIENGISQRAGDLRVIENSIKTKENISDVCPTCGQKIPDVVKPDTTEDKIKLMEISEEIRVLDEKRTDLNTKLDAEIQLEIKSISADTECLASEISSNEKRLISTKNDMSSCESSLSSVKAELDALIERSSRYDETRIKLEKDIQECQDKIESISEELGACQRYIVDKQNHLDVVTKFNTYITRDFRGRLLYNILEHINKYAKMYCRDIFGNENIEIYLDKNNLNIDFSNKSYECLSGGEKQKIDLIVQFSIRDVLSKLFNFSCNILVLDELFDNLDAQGSDRVINTISSRLQDTSSIFIITHHTELQLPFDTTLMVEKNKEGISKVYVR